MAGSPLHRIPALTEPVPPGPVSTSAGPTTTGGSRRRLSPFGQGLLAAAILLGGVVVYAGTWELCRRLTSRGEICMELPSTPTPPQEPWMDNPLLRQQRLGLRLIETLPAATASQRLRLEEQLHSLVREIDSLCRLNKYYTNEEAALLSLATASGTLIVICLVLLAPQGVQNISRTQRTVIFSAGAVLGTALNFLQLGELQMNGTMVQQSYRGHDALLQHLSSSLANQRLETGIAPGPALQPLTTPAAVAQLISGIDAHRLAMPDPRLQLSDSVAQSAWSRLLGSDGGSRSSGDEPRSAAASPPPLNSPTLNR